MTPWAIESKHRGHESLDYMTSKSLRSAASGSRRAIKKHSDSPCVRFAELAAVGWLKRPSRYHVFVERDFSRTAAIMTQVGKITRMKKLAVSDPMSNGDLHRTVSSPEVKLICETASQEGSDRRLPIPADSHTRRDGLGLADDVQALRCAISEKMSAEEIEFPMVGRPVGHS